MESSSKTAKYSKHFARLVPIVAHVVGQVARGAFSESLITEENLENAENGRNNSQDRASELLRVIQTKIKEDETNFDKFISILKSISTCKQIASSLEGEPEGPVTRSDVPSDSTNVSANPPDRQGIPNEQTTTTSANKSSAMLGVLVDVSGSMKNKFALDRSADTIVKRTDAILLIIEDLVHLAEEEGDNTDKRWNCVFIGAFGLSLPIGTCDLLTLLELNKESFSSDPSQGNDVLIGLILAEDGNLEKNHVKTWISKLLLSQSESQILYDALHADPSLLKEMIRLIPSPLETGARAAAGEMFGRLFGKQMTKSAEVALEHHSDAGKFVKEVIHKQSQKTKQPVPELTKLKARPIKEVSEMLDDLLQRKSSASKQSRAKEIIDSIERYIYGFSPMCAAIKDATAILNETNQRKFLFILSDGMASDGDPVPYARQLRDSGVTIATCFLTSDPISNPFRLYEPNHIFTNQPGKQALFEMSSTLRNTEPPISNIPDIADVNWELPPSGESRLFVQANSLDAVNEFSKILTKHGL